MQAYVLALDQGTTSSRAILFDRKGQTVASHQQELTQIYPQPGWVEHDPLEIWETQLSAARETIRKAGIDAGQVAAIGIANQRETLVVWERKTGTPVYNAIVWQCRRSSDICTELKAKGLETVITAKTGLLLDPYFSGTKLKWLLDQQPELRHRAGNGELCCGTVDSWLLFNLTGGHRTDPSNASRTLLYNIHTGDWDDELLQLLDVPRSLLPEIVSSCGDFGRIRPELLGSDIPVRGVAGDQQAALFGQACFHEGAAKNTYGTGCFTLLNTGSKPVISRNRLLTTVAWDLGQGLEYALEGSVFIAGAVVQWLRDQLQILETAPDSERLARSVDDSGGVYFVPALAGLGAPYWDAQTRGTVLGITGGTGRAHLTRAALESIAFQTRDLIDALEKDSGVKIPRLKVDGGASLNGFLMQFQADILGIPVHLTGTADTTALGAAYLAGLHAGYWSGLEDIERNWNLKKSYEPEMDAQRRRSLLSGWAKAVQTARTFRVE
ncbi:Glycerol kinase [subsurface metagenome]